MELVRVPLDLAASPGDVLRALRDDRLPFALTGRWGASRAILGSEPVRVAGAEEALDAVDLPAVSGARDGAIGGGWFGYLGFGLAAAIERLPPAPPRPAPLPGAVLGFYDHVLRLDDAGRWWFEALSPDAAGRRLDALRARLAGAPPARRPWRLDGMTLGGAGADGHRAAVAECVERIAAGELFQANVCLRLDGRLSGSAADAYAEASEVLRPAHGAFLGLDGGAVLSFSPELFLRRVGRTIGTAPIKGTARRDEDDPAAAAAARDALVASAKDAAEHVMIVDLMRNDLGRVAEYGSVRAAPAPDVEPHPGLWHLVTHVAARMRDGLGDGALLRAAFPPGSVTGAPKVQALKVIGELEGTQREVYTGAIGFLSPVAGVELNVAIRTLEVRGEAAWFGCGGGVVADSDPDAELHEALAKARPVLAALGAGVPDVSTARATAPPPPLPRRRLARPDPALGLLETLAVRDGEPVAADLHLARLAASAAEVYGVEPPADLPRRMRASATLADTGVARLRVVLGPDGRAEVGVTPVTAPPAPVELRPVLIAGGLGAHKWADRSPFDGVEGPGRSALLCDMDGGVLEAGSANVWLIEGDRLVTPRSDGRILAGVTRARVLALAGAEEADHISLARLAAADGIVITSAIRLTVSASLPGRAPSDAAVRVAAALRSSLGARSRTFVTEGTHEPVREVP
jgi:para-aminobenzoate synthetase / 4-amino-4-deoxychorismate lyase